MVDLTDLLALASSSLGLVTRSSAAEVGFTPNRLYRLVRAGVLDEPHPGVLRVLGAPQGYDQSVLGACWSLGDDAVASHRTAAALYGVKGFDAAGIDITIARASPLRRTGVTVHRRPDLAPRHRGQIGLVPATSPARTIVDLGTLGMPRLVRRAVDDWSSRRVLRVADVERVLTEVARRGRTGVACVRAALEGRRLGVVDVDSSAEADLADLADILCDAGLHQPAYHHLLRADGTVLAEFDLAYPHVGLAIEVMGLGPHSTTERVAADMCRRNEIALAGWHLLEFEPARLRRPRAVVAAVEAMIERLERRVA